MTITVEVPCSDDHAKTIHDAIMEAAADGSVPHVVVDGQNYILYGATTPVGSHTFHPTDPSQDKHHVHHAPGAGLSYTLVEKP